MSAKRSAFGEFFFQLQEYLKEPYEKQYERTLTDPELVQAICGVGGSQSNMSRPMRHSSKRNIAVTWIIRIGFDIDETLARDEHSWEELKERYPLRKYESGEVTRFSLLKNVDEGEVPLLVGEGLDRIWRKSVDGINPIAVLIGDDMPITGKDEFSERIYEAYAKEWKEPSNPGLPVGIDLRNIVKTVVGDTDGDAWSVWDSGKVLRSLLVGILCGPAGLLSYSREIETATLVDNRYARRYEGFFLYQEVPLGDYASYSNFVHHVDGSLVLRREEAGEGYTDYVIDRRPNVTSFVSDPHAVIAPLTGVETARWSISDVGSTNGTAVLSRRTGEAVLLPKSGEPLPLETGDEIWLAPDTNPLGRDMEGGAVLCFYETYVHEYKSFE